MGSESLFFNVLGLIDLDYQLRCHLRDTRDFHRNFQLELKACAVPTDGSRVVQQLFGRVFLPTDDRMKNGNASGSVALTTSRMAMYFHLGMRVVPLAFGVRQVFFGFEMASVFKKAVCLPAVRRNSILTLFAHQHA